MRKEIAVNYEGQKCYSITLNHDFSHLPEDISTAIGSDRSKKICIVTDSNVAEIYLNKILQLLQKQFAKVLSFVFEAGEQSKNLNTVQKLYEQLKNNGQILIEEYVKQHSKMNALFPYSVNTLRIVSAYKDGKVTILFRAIRIGNGKNVVDNFNHGGMYSVINEKGIIEKPAIDKNSNIYEVHPVTKTSIVGFEIPYFKEAIKMVKEAAKVVKEVGLVGFDIAITENGPVMIEGNQLPGYDIYQSKIHLNEDGTGMKPFFDEVIYSKNTN